jgi:hypothetical protein
MSPRPAVRVSRRSASALIVGLLASIAALGAANPAAAADAPDWSLRPFVDCVWKNNDGTVTVDLGYESFNSSTVTVIAGASNYVTPGAQNQGQPITFAPGSHSNVWVLTMTTANYQTGTWYLKSASMNMTMNGTACNSKPVPMTAGSGAIALGTTALVALGGTYLLIRRRRRSRFSLA